MRITANVTSLDSQGRGIVPAEGTRFHVPYALPGETLTLWLGETAAKRQPELIEHEIVTAAPERVAAPCVYFGRCGGCPVQHYAPAPALAWKAGRVADALMRAGAPAGVALRTVPIAPGQRRRAEFSYRRTASAIDLGLFSQRSDALVPIGQCPALLTPLSGLLAALPPVLLRLDGVRATGRIAVTQFSAGLDMLLTLDGQTSARDRGLLAGFASAHGIARVAVAAPHGPDILAQHTAVRHSFAGGTVDMPPGAFVQASLAGEDAIRAAVVEGLAANAAKARRIIELYAGCGTLSFALAARGQLRGFEGNAAAAQALARASAGHPMTVSARDLARQPLQRQELAWADAVVLDPPFDGAGPQVQPLAMSGVPTILYVSCNPEALQKDAAVLLARGYRAVSAVVIDQFPWTSEVEAVVSFTKPRARKPRPI